MRPVRVAAPFLLICACFCLTAGDAFAQDKQKAKTLNKSALGLFESGNKDQALDWLQKSIEAGFDDPKHIRKDRDLASLRDTARFVELVKLADELSLNSRQKDSSTGEWTDKPNYFDVTVWGGQGESCAQFLSKGRAVGVDDVDVDAASDMGILVCHGPTESNWGGVAEGTITAMLTMLKKVRERDRHLKDGGTWRDQKLQGTYLGSRPDGYAGITLGLIGLGRIGSRIATLLRPWKMRILATDPYVPDSRFAEHGVTRVDLPTLLRESDVVSLHVPLDATTRKMMARRELAMMKSGAILINTCRGPIVDEDALQWALTEGRIAGAGLDVMVEEPPAPNHPLFRLPNVTLTPHSAGPTWENWTARFRNGFDNIQRVEAGRAPLWVVPELRAPAG